MQVVVLWARIGPYHLARLRGAANLASSCEIVGLEIASYDNSHDWARVPGCAGVERRTIFPEDNYESLAPYRIAVRVRQALTELNPCIVAVNGWAVPEARAAINWCRRNNVCCVLMSESKEDDAPRNWLKEALKRRILRHCDAALVGGERQSDYLRKLGFGGEIFIGYDVVDNGFFGDGARAARAQEGPIRGSLGLPDRYFFACSRFIDRKNLDGLLEAYAKYRKMSAFPPWSLVIAGSGPEAQTLRQLERKLGLVGVFWPGFIQYGELPPYYGLASAFVHPALTEPWGLVVNEAIASGLPVLVSQTVGARYELVADGDNGYVFDPGNCADLAGKMLKLASLSDGEFDLMSNASKRIAAEWGPERFAAGLIGAINAAAERLKARSRSEHQLA